jgi:hypothetical protein
MIDQAVVRCTDVEPVKAGEETAGNRRAQRRSKGAKQEIPYRIGRLSSLLLDRDSATSRNDAGPRCRGHFLPGKPQPRAVTPRENAFWQSRSARHDH